MLVLYTGHFTLHAFSALVSFGSDDLNESLPRSANLHLTSSSNGRQTQVQIDAIESNSLQAVRMDGGGKASNFRSLVVIG